MDDTTLISTDTRAHTLAEQMQTNTNIPAIVRSTTSSSTPVYTLTPASATSTNFPKNTTSSSPFAHTSANHTVISETVLASAHTPALSTSASVLDTNAPKSFDKLKSKTKSKKHPSSSNNATVPSQTPTTFSADSSYIPTRIQ